MDLYKSILVSKNQGKKLFAILIDPDKQKNSDLLLIIKNANESKVNYFFIGGSLLINDNLNDCIKTIKENSKIPVILFPGKRITGIFEFSFIVFMQSLRLSFMSKLPPTKK